MPSRVRAPRGNREIVAEPGFAEIRRLVEANRRLLNASDIRIDGVPLRELRTLARQEILGRNDDSPLILTGHQPELFHPGVWVKNFAAAGLAQKFDGTALNLIVDNDLIKSNELRIPTWDSWEPRSVRVVTIPFPPAASGTTWETSTIADEMSFRNVISYVAQATRQWAEQPMLPTIWPQLTGSNLGSRFTMARQLCERNWGCSIRDCTVSQLSATASFRHFVEQIRSDSSRFRDCYNSAIRSYRQRHKLRSQSHPVPELAEDELPFWVLTPDGRRAKATTFTAADANLRPRALTLTLFARLCLGDFFIHGIGGGKYDEVTDEIIRTYYGIPPPAYQILTATLHLPLPKFNATAEDVKRLRRKLRDLHWNPQRYLPPMLGIEHEQLEQSEPIEKLGRRERYREFRRMEEALRPAVEDQRLRTEHQLTRAELETAANAILQQRDFAWILYPEEMLRPFLQQIRAQATGTV